MKSTQKWKTEDSVPINFSEDNKISWCSEWFLVIRRQFYGCGSYFSKYSRLSMLDSLNDIKTYKLRKTKLLT